MLSTVPDDQFDFLWPLFDAKGTGLVEPDEFVMTLGMLKDPNMSTERRVEVCFFMFDTNKTGTLSREEFRAMIQATVNVNLYDLLQTKTGEEGFEKHLQSEYSQENLAFYKAVQAFAKNAAAGDGDAAKAAKDLVQKYVKEGAEEQVNLPGPTTKRCLEKVAAVEAAGGGGAAWADVFKEAEAEIFKLMERDTYKRFRHDPKAVDELVAEFFTQADTSHDGVVTFSEYHTWALSQPSVFLFFHKLSGLVQGLVDEHKKATSFKNKDSPMGTLAEDEA
jgi:hypothetical protein